MFNLKKLLAFILVISSLFAVNLLSNTTLSEVFNNNAICYFAYVNNLNNIDCSKYEVTLNGNGAIIKTDIKLANSILVSGCSVSGECVEVSKDFGFGEICKKLNIKIISSEHVNDRLVVTAYSNILPTYLTSENNKINIQIAETENAYLIGYPLILHSY